MNEPIEFRILQNLQAALLAISLANGFHYDVAQLMVRLDPDQDVEALANPDGPRPFIVIDPKPEGWEYFPSQQIRLVMPVVVHWVGRAATNADDKDAERLRTFLRGCADVEQAIAADLTRGGLAVDTRVVHRELDHGVAGANVWAILDLEVSLHRTYGQPNG